MKTCPVIIALITFLFAQELVASETKKIYIGGILGFNWSFNELLEDNENLSDYAWENLDVSPITVGCEYAYDFLSISYQTSPFKRQIGKLYLTNNELLIRSSITYQKPYKLVKSDSDREGPGWDDDYNYKEYNAYSFNNYGEIGYLFTYDFFIFNKMSYKMLFMHNEFQKPGPGLGILTSIAYNYSTFRSKDILIPEGEREFFNRCGTFKGDKVFTIGPQITPIASYVFENFYIGIGYSMMIMPYQKGKIYTDVENFQISGKDRLITNLFITAGLKANNVMFSGYFGTEMYKSYELPYEDDIIFNESIGNFELRAGVLF